MKRIPLTFCTVLLGAANVWADPVAGQLDSARPVSSDSERVVNSGTDTDSVQALLGVEFKLKPVELALSEELKEAKQQYDAQQYQQAIRTATEFIQGHSNHEQMAAALFLRGESWMQLQQYAETRQDFEALLTHHPDPVQRARAEFRIAEIAMLTGNVDEAKTRFKAFRDRYPQDELNAYVLVYLGEIVSRDDRGEAKALFRQALRRYPGGPLCRRCQLHLAMLQYRDGEIDAAHQAFLELIETGQPTDAEYWPAWYWLAHVEFQKGQLAEASSRFLTFAEARPEHELAAASLYYAADVYRKQREFDRAVALFDRVRGEYGNSNYALPATLGAMQAFRESGDGESALRRFRDLPSDLALETRMQATRWVVPILLRQQAFAEAEALLDPLVMSTVELDEPLERAAYYQMLFLKAAALRGQHKYSVAREVLGRIRLDHVPPELAERVLLVRMLNGMATQDYGEALGVAFQFEASYPESTRLAEVREYMVRCFVALQRFDEAQLKLRELDRMPGAKEHIGRAAEWIGENAYERGDWTTAQTAFALLRDTRPTEQSLMRALTGLGWIAKKQARQEDAAEYFDQFLRVFPQHPESWKVRLAYAETLTQLQRREDAVEMLRPFLDLPWDHPERPQGLTYLAQLAKGHPQFGLDAEAILQDVVDKDLQFETRDTALYQWGTWQRQAGNEQLAERAYRELVEKHLNSPYWSDALYRLAEAAHEKQDDETARRYLTKLITAGQDRNVMPHALFMQGKIQSDEKHWQQARETLRQLLRDYPDSPLRDVARYGVAETFFQEKDFDRAHRLFEILDQAQRFAKGDTWGGMVQLRVAQLAVQRNQLVRAIEVAERIPVDYPEFSLQHEADYLVGRAYASRGEYAKSREAYQRVIAADPDYEREITAMAQWLIGETYFHQKQYILAIKAYEALIADLQYENWQAASHLQIGKCYELLDNPRQARSSYLWVTTRYPDSKWSPEAEYRLKQVTHAE